MVGNVNNSRKTLPHASTVRLGEIAYARSGDKGTSANVGVIAYTQQGYDVLCDQLTTKRVRDFFKATSITDVQRYELPNLHALNFVLCGILADSLKSDAQGKALGQAILEMHIPLDATQLPSCLPADKQS